MSIKKELHAKLKTLILTEIGVDDLTTDTYRAISEDIFGKTRNYISKTTVARYFGINDSEAFSPFVLNSFAQYVGFDSWNDFYKSEAVNIREVVLQNNKDNL